MNDMTDREMEMYVAGASGSYKPEEFKGQDPESLFDDKFLHEIKENAKLNGIPSYCSDVEAIQNVIRSSSFDVRFRFNENLQEVMDGETDYWPYIKYEPYLATARQLTLAYIKTIETGD